MFESPFPNFVHALSPRTLLSVAVAALSTATPIAAHAGSHDRSPPGHGCGVIKGRGEVRPSPGAPWQPLTKGAPSPKTGELRAVSGSLRICLTSGATVELAPGSAIALRGETHVDVGGAGPVAAVDVSLREGEVLVEGHKGTWRPVLVGGAGDAVALSVGAAMRARAIPASDALAQGVAVAVYEGNALVGTRAPTKALPPGHFTVLRGGKQTSRGALAPAPSWIEAPEPSTVEPLAIVASDDAVGVVGARFSAVTGASGYDAEIARDPGFEDVAAHMTLGDAQTTLVSPPLRPGRYFARVTARSADGLLGLPSPARALRVARVVVPPGGALVSGIAVLPHGRAFVWDDPGGLEVSLGSTAFGPASHEIGLGDEDLPASARVRMAGDRSFLALALAPAVVNAEIEMGPKRATWPDDPVWITVRPTSPYGVDPQFLPSLRVTVNLDEVPVSWERDGGVLRATVPPRAGAGPWVVRVEARDHRNKELGRGALEVVGSTSSTR